MRPEITKMMTISTRHVTNETAVLLNAIADEYPNADAPTVYKKGEFGWLIFVPNDYLYCTDERDIKEKYEDIPEDLHEVMLEAYGRNCRWLCLDGDGPVVDKLAKYDW